MLHQIGAMKDLRDGSYVFCGDKGCSNTSIAFSENGSFKLSKVDLEKILEDAKTKQDERMASIREDGNI